MSLAQELWGINEEAGRTEPIPVPVFFTETRKSTELALTALELAASQDHIAIDNRVEVSVVLLNRRLLGRRAVFPTVDTVYGRDQVDVSARDVQLEPGDVRKLAHAALRQRTLARVSFTTLRPINPYLRIDSTLEPGNFELWRQGTIVFPFVTTTSNPNPTGMDESRQITTLERQGAGYSGFAPTFLYEVKAAIEALKTKPSTK